MCDEDVGADIVPISSKARSKVSDRHRALLDELPLSEFQKQSAMARIREIELAERKLEKAAARLGRQSARLLAEVSTRGDDSTVMYRLQVQADAAEAARREYAFDVHRYGHEVKMLWAVLMSVLSVMIVGLGFSVWLIANGREEVGNPILSAIVSGALAYLVGVGTPRELLWRGGPGAGRGS